MRNLIELLIKYYHWLLFIVLEALSLWLLFRFNNYQSSVYFTSANIVSGTIFEYTSFASDYFHLKSDNEALQMRNTQLFIENEQLRSAISSISRDTTRCDSLELDILSLVHEQPFTYIGAKVINNSVNKIDNYLTIDKGENDSIFPDMGIVSPEGIVGIVCLTSAKYSLVLSILNSKSSISCKIDKSGYFGNLVWRGGDPCFAEMIDVPRHADVSVGDLIVTSGYSNVFPEGLSVGTVAEYSSSGDGLTCQIKVRLSSDISKLNWVSAVKHDDADMIAELSNQLSNEQP